MKTRKRYPMSDAIYFIEPTHKSVAKIIADFPENDDFDYDQYGQTHIAFTSNCPDNLMEDISMSEKLVKRTMSFYEANIDFHVYTDNVFVINCKGESFGDSQI